MPLRWGKLREPHIVSDDSQCDSLPKEALEGMCSYRLSTWAGAGVGAGWAGGRSLRGNCALQSPKNRKSSSLIREKYARVVL